MQPEFYQEGTVQRRGDTVARVLKKWLGVLRNHGIGTSDDNPRRLDTKRETEEKILKAKQ